MASYTIPEEIIGVPLFVPDAYDFFSIESAGLPNGDDCLKVLGGTSQDYKALQPAPHFASPNDLFYTRIRTDTPAGPDGVSISFWYKAGNITGVTNGIGQTLMGAMSALYGSAGLHASGPYVTSGGDGGLQWMSWFISEHHSGSGCAIRFFLPIRAATTFGNYVADVTITPNTWTFLTFVINRTGTILKWAKDLDVSYTNGTTSFTGNGAHADITGPQFLCIGSYSDQGSQNGRPGDWYLGKLAFHDHELNATERTLLYRSMIP